MCWWYAESFQLSSSLVVTTEEIMIAGKQVLASMYMINLERLVMYDTVVQEDVSLYGGWGDSKDIV